MSSPEPPKYPLLEEFLALREMALQPAYTIRDVAKLFAVSTRSIQVRVSSGQLASRDLPGRAKFLASDLEQFLHDSRRKRGTEVHQGSPSRAISRRSTGLSRIVRDVPDASEYR